MDPLASKCEFCDQELTKFTMRLVAAKKMPKKALKLYHNPALQLESSSTFNPDQTSFKKYIHRISMPKNVVKIKCGTCSKFVSLPARKPVFRPTSSATPSCNPGATPTSEQKRSRKRKRGTPQQDNAGLIIPALLRSSANPSLATLQPKPSAPVPSKSSQSILFTSQHKTVPVSAPLPPPTDEAKKKEDVFRPSTRLMYNEAKKSIKDGKKKNSATASPPNDQATKEDVFRPSTRMMYNAAKKSIRDGKKQKQKEISQLQKALLKSKHMVNSGSSSLGSFLGNE